MSSADKRLIALLGAMVLLLVVIVVLMINVFGSDSSESSLSYIQGQTSANQTQGAQQQNNGSGSGSDSGSPQGQQQAGEAQTTASSSGGNANQTVSMTEQEMLAMLTQAVNKTKAYTGSFTVYHNESFEANVTECTGGSIVASIANSLVGMVLDPSDETLEFSGGTATNSDGETVTILLPQKGQFRLEQDSISSISASKSGNDTVIYVKLVSESVGMNDVPQANASAVGYLDVSSLDISIMTVTQADIVYTGSTLEVHIRPDGYVSYAKYTIPMHAQGAAERGVIKGSAVFDGMQTEIWAFNW